MDYNFTGSLSQRRINLGGSNASGTSSAQIAASARADRAARQEIRRRESSALRLQAWWRACTCRREIGRKCADEFWRDVGSAEREREVVQVISMTRSLIWALKGNQRGVADMIEAWAHVLIEEDLLFAPFVDANTSAARSWATQLRLLVQPLISCLAYKAPAVSSLTRLKAAQHALLILHNLTRPQGKAAQLKSLTGPFQTLAQHWAHTLVKADLHKALADHLLFFPADRKASPTLPPAVSLALAPFTVFAASSAGTIQRPIDVNAQSMDLDIDPPSQARALATDTFVRHFLNVPNLPARVPLPALTQLVSHLPGTDVLERVIALGAIREASRISQRSTSARAIQRKKDLSDEPFAALSRPHILATLVALLSPRVHQFNTASLLKFYLDALSTLQDALPRSFFQGALDDKTSGATTAADAHFIESHIDEVAAEKVSISSRPDNATFKRLTGIVAPHHLQAILAASNKNPSTRPALTRFLLSTLLAWPTEARERVFATTMFGSPGGSGGLVRELWRGWVRSSALARTLASADSKGDGARAALSTLEDGKYETDWYPFILLVEIYSRTLLTLGDDEFYPVGQHGRMSSATSAGPSAGVPTSSRNPLSLDDVISFSALVRNLTFALYWLEGAPGSSGASLDLPLYGLRMLRSELRSILTAALRQIHARDARRQFAPEGHWLMTSSMDLNSFLETVLLEEDELGAAAATADTSTAAAAAHDDAAMDQQMDTTDDGRTSEEEANATVESSVSRRVRARRGKNNNLTARQLAFLSPRLGILNNIPFVIHFDLRVKIFRQFIRKDRKRIGLDNRVHRINAYHKVKVRRGFVAEDGFSQLNHLGPAIKGDVEIQFQDEFGQLEAGIDGGGLFKEFLTSLVKEAFDTDRGLWLATEQQELYPNPHSYARQAEQLEWYAFLGRVLGKAMYEGILVDIKFARFFLSKWLGKQGYFDDLASLDSLDPNLYKGLMYLKNYTGDVEADLALNFTVQDDELGVVKSTELVPGGSHIPVTKENRLSYIYRMSRYRLTGQIAWQCDAFFRGLSDIIDTRWLRILDVDELRVLVCGTEEPIDVEDLRRNTILHAYHEKDDAISFFWQALQSFSPDERRAFLKFVTSCPSPPLLGFSQLSPKLGIQKSSDDTSRLPTAATCMNLLKLPNYTSLEQCRSKLLYAIKSGAGFDLS
ncbi:HECT-domain-containing protein [Ceraceosorus guamensis]|uniref:HECT-type E3 ubiquitin transferase n=1 Tax=Ceraceosorus guamensis TaxID=1522189 RepID=A0A316VT95_9BASI|nr:HECT-domain-containing protein [Ceraceosorus guamensis]PWN40258.1 HECT-domain-containing protein [Ceraceosorus guamensis]